METIFLKWFGQIKIAYVHCSSHSRYFDTKNRTITLFTMDPKIISILYHTVFFLGKKKKKIISILLRNAQCNWGSPSLFYTFSVAWVPTFFSSVFPQFIWEKKGLVNEFVHYSSLLAGVMDKVKVIWHVDNFCYKPLSFWHWIDICRYFWDPIYYHYTGLCWSVTASLLHNPWIEGTPDLVGRGRSFLGKPFWDD